MPVCVRVVKLGSTGIVLPQGHFEKGCLVRSACVYCKASCGMLGLGDSVFICNAVSDLALTTLEWCSE